MVVDARTIQREAGTAGSKRKRMSLVNQALPSPLEEPVVTPGGKRRSATSASGEPMAVDVAATPKPFPMQSMHNSDLPTRVKTGDGPLTGLQVVIIHVKDNMTDGELMEEGILRELKEHEATAKLSGRGLGCE